jgi:hypothetical protein
MSVNIQWIQTVGEWLAVSLSAQRNLSKLLGRISVTDASQDHTAIGLTFFQVHWMSTECPLNVHWIFTESSLNLHWIFTVSSLNLHCIFTESSLNLHWIFTESSLNLHWIFTDWMYPRIPKRIRRKVSKAFVRRRLAIRSQKVRASSVLMPACVSCLTYIYIVV